MAGRNGIFVILDNNLTKQSFTYLEEEIWNNISSNNNFYIILSYSKPQSKKWDFVRHYAFKKKLNHDFEVSDEPLEGQFD